MALRVNLNMSSQLAQMNLRNSARRLEKVYAELSSGERINRAGDDATGLAISQVLRSQVRSLNQAARNTSDGQSVLDTAESAMANMQDLVQRMRELAVQAANDTNSTQNRIALQSEMDQLSQEIDRLANSVQFNRRNLLDGTFVNQRLQIGLGEDDFLPLSIPNMRTTNLGQQAVVTSSLAVGITPLSGGGDLTINGIDIGASAADGVSFVNAAASAIAKANAINRLSAQTGVTAEVEPSVFQAAGATIGGVSLDGTTRALYINGVNIGAVDVSAGDSTGALRAAINRVSAETGVTADIGAGGELVLTAADGRNFQVTTTGAVADDLGLSAAPGDLTGVVATGKITLRSASQINVGGTDLSLIGFTAAESVTVPNVSTALASLSVVSQDDAQSAIASLDIALEQISRVRANVGAISNRLEDTQLQLQTNSEQLTASDSRIRDSDYAEATARATQEQIIQQAATAILAQANLLPQMALTLLER